MRPDLRFRSIKLKELYRRAVVHNERDRDALRRAIGFYEYLLSSDGPLDVVHHKRYVRHSLDQFRKRAVGIELHPLHTVRTLKVPRGIKLELFAVVLCRQRSVR